MWFFFQAEDGIRDLVRSRGLGDVYKRQVLGDGVVDPPVGTGVFECRVGGYLDGNLGFGPVAGCGEFLVEVIDRSDPFGDAGSSRFGVPVDFG